MLFVVQRILASILDERMLLVFFVFSWKQISLLWVWMPSWQGLLWTADLADQQWTQTHHQVLVWKPTISGSAEPLASLDFLHNCLLELFEWLDIVSFTDFLWVLISSHLSNHTNTLGDHFVTFLWSVSFLLIDFHFPATSMLMLEQLSITTPLFPYILKETVSLTESWWVSVNEHKTGFT